MLRIAYQGAPGAYSQLAALALEATARTKGLADFGAVAAAVANGQADLGVLPVWNSIVGTVPGAEEALGDWPELTTVERVDQRIAHCLLALPGADIPTLRWVESHPVALSQCARWLSAQKVEPRAVEDTAGAAEAIAQDRDWTRAAIAAEGAAARYGLVVLARDIADAVDNVTTFAVIARRSVARVEAA
jgi:prephenate dehydratase